MPAASAASPSATEASRPLKALWFDGLSTEGRRVYVLLEAQPGGPQLIIHPLEPQAEGLVLANGQVQWPQTWGRSAHARRLTVDLGGHGSLEVQGAAQWQAAYEQAGGRRKVAERLQTRWKLLLLFAFLTLAGLGAFFRYGTPMAAMQIARFVPLGWETSLTDETMRTLDAHVFNPSKLGATRQDDLRRRFDAMHQAIPAQFMRYGGYAPLWRLEFRSGVGANALAFPGGLVILTDEMVELAERDKIGDDALLGILAHEMGHVTHRHSSRKLIEQGVLNGVLSLAMGDASGWVTTASMGLTALAYSRDHEREADCFSLALMKRHGIPTASMARLFAAATHTRLDAQERAEPSAGFDWLSTHPDSGGRIEWFRRGEALSCQMETGRLLR